MIQLPFEIFFAVVMALSIAGGVLTVKALDAGGSEANGLMKGLMDKLGVVPALVVTKIALGAVIWYVRPEHPVVQVLMLVVFGWIVANNIKVLKKLER